MENSEPTTSAPAAAETKVEPTAATATTSKTNPPAVITVDTSGKEGDEENGPTEGDKGFGQARTPKHANKTRDDADGATDSQQKITPERASDPKPEDANAHHHQNQQGHYGPPRRPFGNFPPPRPYEGRPLGGNGAFQPHEPRRQPPPPSHAGEHGYYGGGGGGGRSPMQVSPGGNEYHRGGYYNGGGSHRNGPPRPEGGAGYSQPPSHHHPPGYYEQRGYNEYPPGPPGRGYDNAGPGGGFRGQYPPPNYPPQSYGGYPPEGRGNPPSWGNHPPPYHHGPPGQYPPDHYGRHPSSTHDGRYNEGSNNTFSRAVSSSFDRSIKSRTSEEKAHMDAESKNRKPSSSPTGQNIHDHHPQDASMAGSDNLSWHQLNQVHSVDENAIRERLEKKEGEAKEGNHIKLEQPASNSSSLTNSPTEGPEQKHAAKEAAEAEEAAATEAANQPSSLDSLSSVASAQAPMDTGKLRKSSTPSTERNLPPTSPGSESASLDLMKCSSGSSGLLHLPSQHRSMEHEGLLFDGKRARDEERGDINTSENAANGDEIRRAPSEYDEVKEGNNEQPPPKKVRLQEDSKDETKGKDSKAKASPLSISCSPPSQSPGDSKRKKDKSGSTNRTEASNPTKASDSKSKQDYHTSPQPMEGSYFDKPPSYTYSMDSAPSFPRDSGASGHRKQPSIPSLPPRPGSSSSSTITPMGGGPMQVDGREHHDSHTNAVVPSIPSWEIHAQDSFGGGSVGGGQGLMSNFSFQDYEGSVGYGAGETGPNHHPPHSGSQPPHTHSAPHHPGPHPPIESRNQSFEGGHYHGGGSFQRSDSMDVSYSGRSGGPPSYQDGYKPPQGHAGPFPPHAPSWGTAGSGGSHPPGYPHQGHYGQYGGRMGQGYPPHQGGVMRNYSEDSGHRASPPPGPPGSHPRMHPGQRPPAGFQPPPEFAAPHNPHLTRRPPPAVYIMSSNQGSHHHPPAKRGTGVFSWTKDDDMRLTEIMKKYKNPRDWEPIAKEHGCGKTPKECHERWIRYLKPGVRKGQWTDYEDSIVIEAVTTSSEQPFTRWSDLAQRLPGRVGKQIRDRWVNHLNPNINHLPFSREDDLLLWEGHKKLGKRWVEISTKFFNSTRSENHIKNRWYSASFKKFISNEFGPEAYSGNKASKSKEESGASKSKKKGKAEDDATVEAV